MGIFGYIIIAALIGALGGGLSEWLRARGVNSTLCNAIMLGALFVAGALSQYVSKDVEKKSDHLVVGTSADFPPFAFIEQGKIVGFDIDLVEEVGRRLNKKIELKNMPFSTLLPALQLGTLQMVVAGLTATPERAKQVFFTQPYLDNEPLVIVSLQSAPLTTVESLQGKEVVVNQGYTADLFMSAVQGVTLRRLKSPAEAFLALQAGRADAFVTARNSVKPFFDQYGDTQFSLTVIPETQENSSIAVAPQYQGLYEHVERALEAMKKDGSLERLRTKWGL